jgi:hypothetical protein
MQIAATTPSLDRWMIACLLATAIARVGGAHDVEVPTASDLQVAVLPDGFVAMVGAPSDRHLGALDWDGKPLYRRAVPVIAPEARVVGTSAGPAVGWVENKKLELARVSGDGELTDKTTWGKRVNRLCEGTASNASRWGIAWLENDGRVWVLHGNASKPADESTHVLSSMGQADAEMTRTVWCGVTSAGEKIALLWADQHKRMQLNLCDRKGCSGAVMRVPLSKKETYAGLACLEAACLVVARDARGVANLGWFTAPHGRLTWWKPLTDATPDTTFSVTAAGDRAFVVGYVTREGATATRVIESGSMVRAWADPHSTETPVLTWANDRLLAAHRHGDSYALEVVALPR